MRWTAGLSSFYFLQILGEYIEEYAEGFGFQSGFQIESQEEMMARVEAEAQAEMTKRLRKEAAYRENVMQMQEVAMQTDMPETEKITWGENYGISTSLSDMEIRMKRLWCPGLYRKVTCRM